MNLFYLFFVASFGIRLLGGLGRQYAKKVYTRNFGGYCAAFFSTVAGLPAFRLATQMKTGAAPQVISSDLLVHIVNQKDGPHLARSAVHKALGDTKVFCRDCAGVSVRAIHDAGEPIGREASCRGS